MHLGIDIGGTNLKAGILLDSGNITDITTMPVTEPDRILHQINLLLSEYFSKFRISSCGIGLPGVISGKKVIVSPNLPALNGIILNESFSIPGHIPAAFENDANTAALAELSEGAGKGKEYFIYVTLGTGIGGAIIYRGEILKGQSGGAGEVGHVILNSFSEPGKELSYQTGTLEYYAGRKGILALAREIYSPGTPPGDVKEIAEAAAKKDEKAVEIISKISEITALGIITAMNLLDIRTVIIGGGISLIGDMLFDTIRETVKRRALPSVAAEFEILQAKFLYNTGIAGAALLGKYYGTIKDPS